MTLEELKVIISAETQPLVKEMQNVKRQLGGLQSETNKITSGIQNSFKKLLGGIIALKIGQQIGRAITNGIKEAMNVESALAQIKRIMGESTNQFLKWADANAQAFGMAKSEILKYGAVYGNLISGFAKNAKETTKYTEDLLKASAVVASATGRTMEDTMERIRSGLLGNTESIEDLGINVNVAMIESTKAFQQFANGKSWQQLNFQTQQQIRLMAILEQANKKYGNSLANTTATQMMMFRAELKNIQLGLGQAFMPILNIVLPILTALASKLAYVMNILAQFSQALFGKSSGAKAQTRAANQQANAVGGIGDAYGKVGEGAKKAGKEAKKAQGFLAAFDEVNSIADKADSGDSDGNGSSAGGMNSGAVGTTPVDFTTNAPEISAKVQAMADAVKAKVKEIKDSIVANKEIIISVIGGIVAAFVAFETITFFSTIPEIIAGIGASLSVLTSAIGIASITVGSLVAAFLYLYQTNEEFRNNINAVWSEISATLNNFVSGTLKPIFNCIVNDFLAPIGKAFKDYILPVLAELFVGIGKILNDILKLLKSTVDNIWDIVKPALDLIKTVVTDFLEIVKKLWDKYGQDLIKNIREFIQGVQETFQLLWDKVLYPIIKPFLEMLSWLWTEHLSKLVYQVGQFIMKCVNGALELYNGFIKPIIDWMIIEFGPKITTVINLLVNLFGSMVAGISDLVKALFKILGGIVDFIVGVFTGNWKKAWEGVRDIFGGIFDSLVTLVKTPLNYIIDMINGVIEGLNSIHFEMPDWDWLPDKVQGKSFGIHIPHIPKLARGGIVDSPTIAQIGEAGKEMVVPLENTSFVNKLASSLGTAVLSAMQFSNNSNSNNSNGGDIYLQIDGTTFARIMNPYNAKEKQRVGNNVIIKAT